MSAISVKPKNWKSAAASCASDWWASYRFYDASGIVKEVRIKAGVNRLKTPAERRALLKQLIDQEMEMLQAGYNPISKAFPDQQEFSTWEDAVLHVLPMLTVEATTRKDMESRIAQVIKAARALGVGRMSVQEVRLRHIMAVLDKAAVSSYAYNKCRAYLGIVYKRLRQLEAVDHNFIRDIDKKKTVKKIRKVLTDQERVMVADHLKKHHYPFWRFTEIFTQAFSREIELLELRVKDVDISGQRFKVVDRKGRRGPVEKWKTITNSALPLWKELLQDADPNWWVFGHGFVPGPLPYKRAAVTQTWWKLVKKHLGVGADFYSLRHMSVTDAVTQAGKDVVISLTGHTSPAMIDRVYDIGKEQRDHEREKLR